MANSSPAKNLLPLFLGLIINDMQYDSEVAQWAALSCNPPQPGTDKGVRGSRSNWLAVRPPK